jgi:hypothetical protein
VGDSDGARHSLSRTGWRPASDSDLDLPLLRLLAVLPLPLTAVAGRRIRLFGRRRR